MKSLGYVIAKSHNEFICIEPIKNYTRIADEQKKYYCSENPVVYEILDGRQFSTDLSRIVKADFTKSTANIGTCYKLPKTAIEYIIEWG